MIVGKRGVGAGGEGVGEKGLGWGQGVGGDMGKSKKLYKKIPPSIQVEENIYTPISYKDNVWENRKKCFCQKF